VKVPLGELGVDVVVGFRSDLGARIARGIATKRARASSRLVS
jgi:hypothetical protein